MKKSTILILVLLAMSVIAISSSMTLGVVDKFANSTLYSLTRDRPQNPDVWQTSNDVLFNYTINHDVNKINLNLTMTFNCDQWATWHNISKLSEVNMTGVSALNDTTFNLTVNGIPNSDSFGHVYWLNCTNSTYNLTYKTLDTKLLVDATSPTVSFTSPYANGTFFNNNTFSVRFTPVDWNLQQCKVFLDGVTNDTIELPTNGTKREHLFDSIPDGFHTYNVACTDKAGNRVTNGTNMTMFIDTVDPVIGLVSPVDASWSASRAINITVNVTDSNVKDCYLYLSNQSNVSQFVLNSSYLKMSNRINTNFSIKQMAGSGQNNTYYWYVTCNDSINRIDTTQIYSFKVDNLTSHPINATLPANGTTYALYNPMFVWTPSWDLNFDRYEISVYNSSMAAMVKVNITSNSTVSTRINMFAFKDLTSNGRFTWNITTYDKSGLFNETLTITRKEFSLRGSEDCYFLEVGWNYCGVMRTTALRAADLASEIGSNVTMISWFNETKALSTHIVGTAVNNFTLANATSVLIYVSSNTLWANMNETVPSYVLTPTYRYFNLTNGTTGNSVWNSYPMQILGGTTFQGIEDALNSSALNGTTTDGIIAIAKINSSGVFSYFVNMGEPYNNTFVGYRETVYFASRTLNATKPFNWTGLVPVAI